MSKIHHTSHLFSAAIVTLTLLWALPASSEEVAIPPGATTPAEVVVGSNEKIAALSNFEAMALASKRKRKPLKLARTRPVRVAALSNHDWSCSGAWCGRQFVLMIGIGY